MPAFIAVEAVKPLPEPLDAVSQPEKVYPSQLGLAGKSATPMTVDGGVTIFTAQTVSVPSFNLKVTV
jgi:hypothetical protein